MQYSRKTRTNLNFYSISGGGKILDINKLRDQLKFDESELQKIEAGEMLFHEIGGVYWKNLKVSIFNYSNQISFIEKRTGA